MERIPPVPRRRRVLGCVLLVLLLTILVTVLVWPGAALVQRAGHLLLIWTPVVWSRSPNTIVHALESSGPVFIKLAQWLSTRRDVLDSELCDGMATLHERVSVVASPQDRQRAESAIPGLRVQNLLGGGCIALVFKGELDVNGTQAVAVKVRRKGVDKLLHTDLKLMRLVASIAERLVPSLQWLAMPEAVDNFGWYLIQQINLTVEAEHLRQFESNYQGLPNVGVPKVFTATEGVLVTEIAEGVSLSKFVRENRSKPVREVVFSALTDLMARMVLVDNFIHGDLHPGNLFIAAEEPENGGELMHGPLHLFDKELPYRITLIDAGIAIGMTKNLTIMMTNSMKKRVKNHHRPSR